VRLGGFQKKSFFLQFFRESALYIIQLGVRFHMVRSMYSGHESVSDVSGCVTFFLTAPGGPRSAANATVSLVGWKNQAAGEN
jgi:hypothetical protein